MDLLFGMEEVNEFYLLHIAEKAMVSKRKKADFHRVPYSGKRHHWANRTGRYHDEETRKGPKYWHGQKPVRVYVPIRNHRDMVEAINLISSGERCLADYRGVAGLNRDRLRLVQSQRDKALMY